MISTTRPWSKEGLLDFPPLSQAFGWAKGKHELRVEMIDRVFSKNDTIGIHLYAQRLLDKRDIISKAGGYLKQNKTKWKDKNKTEVMMSTSSNYVYLSI